MATASTVRIGRRRFTTFTASIGVLLLIAAGLGGLAPEATAATITTAGTDVCGTLPDGAATWNASGGPYRICPDGLTVPLNSSLTLDGTLGGFAVLATGPGGLTVDRGSLSTANTSTLAQISFDSAAGAAPGSWAGLSGSFAPDEFNGCARVFDTFDLSYVTIAHAVRGIDDNGRGMDPCLGYTPDYKGEVRLDHVAVSDTSAEGIRVTAANLGIADSSIDRTGLDGLFMQCHYSGPSAYYGISLASVHRVTVTAAGHVGIRAEECASPDIGTNTIRNSGHLGKASPAMIVTQHQPQDRDGLRLGQSPGIAANIGSGNGMDAIALEGPATAGYTWLTPTNAQVDHLLGYLNLGLSAAGTTPTVFPAGSIVKSGVIADGEGYSSGNFGFGGSVVSTGPGTVFTSLEDDSVGPPTCASALSSSCVPSKSDWAGLANYGNMEIENSAFRHANYCLRASAIDYDHNSPTLTKVVSSAFEDCGEGIAVRDAEITDVSISNVSGGISPPYPAAIDAEGSLALTNVDVSQTTVPAVTAHEKDASSTISINGLTVDHALTELPVAAYYGSPFDTSPAPTYKHIHVTNSGLATSPGNVAFLAGDHLTIGPGKNVDDITGSANAQDTVCLTGYLDGGMTWKPIMRNTQSQQDLGYDSCSPEIVGSALTIPPNIEARIGGPTLVGATFDASGGGDRIVSSGLTLKDGSDGTPSIAHIVGAAWTAPAGSPYPVFDLRSSSRDALFEAVNSSFVATAPPSPPSPVSYSGELNSHGTRVNLTGSTLKNYQLAVTGAPLELTNSRLTGSSGWNVTLLDADNSFFRDTAISDSHYDSVKIESSLGVQMDRTSVRAGGASNGELGSERLDGIHIDAASSLAGTCNSVTTNQSGIGTDSPVTFTDSDLYGNQIYSPRGDSHEITTTAPINAERDWWGQAGGPLPGQIDHSDLVDSTRPAATQSPVGTIAISGNRKADGTYSNGKVVISLSLNRKADTTVQPHVSVRRPDGTVDQLSGSWTDDHTWTADYQLTGADGPYSVMASSARSCVADPNTNSMADTSATFMTTTPSTFIPVAPGTAYTTGTTPLAAGTDRDITLTGVPTNATAVVISAQVTNPTTTGYLRLTPAGTNPTSSSLFFTTGQHTSTYATVKTTNGKIRLHLSTGKATIALDIAGYYTAGSGSTFTPVAPGTAYTTGTTPLAAGTDRDITLTGVPTNATAVVISAQVTNPTTTGYLRLTPAGTNPTSSSLFFTTGQHTSTYATVKTTNGKIRLHLSTGKATIALDIAGYYTAGSGSTFTPVAPGTAYTTGTTPLAAGTDRDITLTGVPTNATAVVISAQVTNPTTTGYLRLTPAGTNPTSSSLFFTTGQHTSTYATVKTTNGKIRLHLSTGKATIALDIAGYYTNP